MLTVNGKLSLAASQLSLQVAHLCLFLLLSFLSEAQKEENQDNKHESAGPPCGGIRLGGVSCVLAYFSLSLTCVNLLLLLLLHHQ